MAMSKQLCIEFIYNALSDIQGTIRSIDTKLGLLIIFLGIPFSSLSEITHTISIFLQQDNCYPLFWDKFVVILFIIIWIIAFISAIMGIISIDNPAKHLKGIGVEYSGDFYQGNLFKFKFVDNLCLRKSRQSKITLDKMLEKYPVTENEILKELVFEQAKLAFIRDLKIFRQRCSFILSFIWMALGFYIYIATKI